MKRLLALLLLGCTEDVAIMHRGLDPPVFSIPVPSASANSPEPDLPIDKLLDVQEYDPYLPAMVGDWFSAHVHMDRLGVVPGEARFAIIDHRAVKVDYRPKEDRTPFYLTGVYTKTRAKSDLEDIFYGCGLFKAEEEATCWTPNDHRHIEKVSLALIYGHKVLWIRIGKLVDIRLSRINPSDYQR